MAIISDYQDENQTPSSSSQPKPSKTIPFSSTFDPSKPSAFLEKVFDFIAKESTDFFDKDSAEKVVLSVVRAAKVKKAKAVAVEKANIAAQEKKLNDKKSGVATEKKDGESNLAGKKITNFIPCPSSFFICLIITYFLKVFNYY